MVNSKNPSSKKLMGATIALALLATACNAGKTQGNAGAGGPGGPSAIPVKWQTAEQGTITESTEHIGYLEAKKRVRLAPRIEGRILRILVDNGDRVRAGQRIIELQPTREQEDVRAATAQVNVERANLKATQAELTSAQAERARASAQVEQARANLARAQADIESNQADVVLAQKNYERFAFLVKEGAEGQQTLDEQTNNINAAKARLQAQRKAIDSSKESLNAAKESLRAAETGVKQALANIDSQKATVARAEGQLGVSSQTLSFNFVTAPINGTVGDFPNKVGDFVQIGDELTSITDNQTFDLQISVPTERRSQLRIGQPVELVDADGKVEVTGQISFVSPNVNQNNQTILTKATFRNNGSLRDNEYVNARVVWDRKPGVLVPKIAVDPNRIGGQNFVYVAQESQSKEGKASLIAKQAPVTLGSIQGQDYAVLKGLKAGDRVITTNLLNLKDGAAITQQSMASEKTSQK
jgi:RND family efflux transporter MFP subunit